MLVSVIIVAEATCWEQHEFDWHERRAIIEGTLLYLDKPVEPDLSIWNYPILSIPMMDEDMGYPITPQFTVRVDGKVIHCRGFPKGTFAWIEADRLDCRDWWGIINSNGEQR